MCDATPTALKFNLLDAPLLFWRDVDGDVLQHGTLPELFVAMLANEVRDFPALRAHQRHPWHAFLVQLAAIALHAADAGEPWADASGWRAALLALTPHDLDGAAWCLVSPPAHPAFLQPATAGDDPRRWAHELEAPDELDMLVTSKNHDLKAARMRRCEPQDWVFALLSLQTQEGFLGAGNYGISRMNGGFASRPGVGVVPTGAWGSRWRADVECLLSRREALVEQFGFRPEGGHALLWTLPWSGTDSLSMASLDPFYVEVCRRVRLEASGPRITARVTGDPWTPIDIAEAKALTVPGSGFSYRLMSELLAGEQYAGGAAQRFDGWPEGITLQLLARATVRGQGKTEGYHERQVPVSPRLRRLLLGPQRAVVGQIAKARIDAIAAVRGLLWHASMLLFANGEAGDRDEATKAKATRFTQPFERLEDARFFADLIAEVEADEARQPELRIAWLLGLVDRAEQVLREAFDAGPRSGMQRYKARSAALSRFHSGLRGPKAVWPPLAQHYAQAAVKHLV